MPTDKHCNIGCIIIVWRKKKVAEDAFLLLYLFKMYLFDSFCKKNMYVYVYLV